MFEFDRVSNMDMLHRAWQKVAGKDSKSYGIDGVDLSVYRGDLMKHLRMLQAYVVTGNYLPQKEKVFKQKNRDICISCVDEKIMQTALSEIITSVYKPPNSVHGFIPKRSIFTAKQTLDHAMKSGMTDFLKVDIQKFYESTDIKRLFDMVSLLIGDEQFLQLLRLMLNVHKKGLSTGSCLSPVLSNLYLCNFDNEVANNTDFYTRYVDDMLISPIVSLNLVKEKLGEIGFEINEQKTAAVNVASGFRYLGFDIKSNLNTAIENRDFALAEKIFEVQECELSAETETVETIVETQKVEPDFPAHLIHVQKKCYIIRLIIQQAKTEHYLSYPDKMTLLQVFHCLGDAGMKYIHYILSFCENYDYATTQNHIRRYKADNPLGCKKLCERFGDNSKCSCKFSAEKMYPTPIIHAQRIQPDCFVLNSPKENIGHFKSHSPKRKAADALSSLMELNKKKYEIEEQQAVFKGQLESLFERSNSYELQTPQGLLVKTDDGIFIKVG
ncbi:MAG: hypothetical protein CVU99_06700 [Firmicutes bacterium HGW-Firmicutes-4]|nr:MAG: hypothetical protein CVU99_06700 [Firmicutes bacterium HGW-Firmicutes-4]